MQDHSFTRSNIDGVYSSYRYWKKSGFTGVPKSVAKRCEYLTEYLLEIVALGKQCDTKFSNFGYI